MTVEPTPIKAVATAEHARGSLFLQLLRTTDHKSIGRMYMVTSFAFFMIGGVMAELPMRTELAGPGRRFLSQEQYNQLFTMHGTIMLLLFATPLVFAFANLVPPPQIGSPRRRVSAAERLVLLAIPFRRHRHCLQLRNADRRGGHRLVRLLATDERREFARVYEQRSGVGDLRVLVDRIWPRGLSKASADLDMWCKEIAPSTGLRRRYRHTPSRFREFRERYLSELDDPAYAPALARLHAAARRHHLTLLTAVKDLGESHAMVLAEHLRSLGE